MNTATRPQAAASTPATTFDPNKLTRLLADPSKPLTARLATVRGYIVGYAQVPGLLRVFMATGDEREVGSIIEKHDQLDRVHLLPLDVVNALAAGRTGPVVAQVDGIDPIHSATAAQALVELEPAVVAELRLRAVSHHFHASSGEFIDEPTAGHLIAAAAEVEPLLVAWAREADRLRAEAEVEFARAVANAANATHAVAAVEKPATVTTPVSPGSAAPAAHVEGAEPIPDPAKRLAEFLNRSAGGRPLGKAKLKRWAENMPGKDGHQPPANFAADLRQLTVEAGVKWPKDDSEWHALAQRRHDHSDRNGRQK